MWTSLNFRRDVIARKEHRCYLCELAIKRGEAYCLHEGVHDDGFVRMKMHSECEAATSGWDEINWEVTEPAEFREMMEEARAFKAKEAE